MISGFINNCIHKPNNRAVIINDEVYSYRQLYAIVSLLAARVRVKEQKADTFIGIFVDHSVNCYASILAALYSGSGFLPLNRKFPAERLAGIIDSSGIQKIYCRENDAAMVNSILSLTKSGMPVAIVQNEFELGELPDSGTPVDVVFPADQLAYLLFTSGSTGVPKGISITAGNFKAFLNGMVHQHRYAFTDQDSFLQLFELSFDVSIACMFIPLEIGACFIPVSTENIVFVEALEVIKQYNVSVVTMAPSAVAYMKQLRLLDEFQFPFVRYTFLTGEALSNSLALAWQDVAINSIVENAYGPTEVTVWSFMYRWHRQDSTGEIINGLVPIGTPLADVDYLIVDDNFNQLAENQFGELLLYGSQVAPGYWKNESQTSKMFVKLAHDTKQGYWYRTGDIVTKNSKGNVVYINRKDNQVQINGFRVELGEIEFRIREFTKNDSVVVIPVYDANQNISLVAFIAKAQFDSNEIKKSLSATLPAYMIPRKFYSITEIPLNNSGKVDKIKLKEIANGTQN